MASSSGASQEFAETERAPLSLWAVLRHSYELALDIDRIVQLRTELDTVHSYSKDLASWSQMTLRHVLYSESCGQPFAQSENR